MLLSLDSTLMLSFEKVTKLGPGGQEFALYSALHLERLLEATTVNIYMKVSIILQSTYPFPVASNRLRKVNIFIEMKGGGEGATVPIFLERGKNAPFTPFGKSLVLY